MPDTSCPHYPPAGSVEEEVTCRGCGATIVNPASRQAQAKGRIGTGAPARVAAPGLQSAKQKGRAEGGQ